MVIPAFFSLLALSVGCSGDGEGDSGSDTAALAVDYAAPGRWHPGRHTSVVMDEERGRELTIETWYPTGSDAADSPIADLVVDPSERAAYETLLADAPEGCPALQTQAAPDATPEPPPLGDDGWPVIAMSHCHNCTRFSTVSVAEHLASWGFIVVAPDHAGNTLFDELAGDSLPLDTETLAIRQADLEFALDQVLAGQLVDQLQADSRRAGVYGHSFGAVTAGMVLQERLDQDGGPVAGMFVGAPPENPFLPGVSMENLGRPLMFELLEEDHSIGEAGNVLIESNFAAAPDTAWLFKVADAGHWSPSDLVGLTDGFMPGCGDDTRESTGEAFTYVDPVQGRSLSASLAAGFFSAYVVGEPSAVDWLGGWAEGDGVSVESH